jgi:hypothetical protein
MGGMHGHWRSLVGVCGGLLVVGAVCAFPSAASVLELPSIIGLKPRADPGRRSYLGSAAIEFVTFRF